MHCKLPYGLHICMLKHKLKTFNQVRSPPPPPPPPLIRHRLFQTLRGIEIMASCNVNPSWENPAYATAPNNHSHASLFLSPLEHSIYSLPLRLHMYILRLNSNSKYAHGYCRIVSIHPSSLSSKIRCQVKSRPI